MQRVFRVSANALALAIAVMLVTDMALAEKPSLAGKGKDRGDDASSGGDVRVSIQFDTRQQTVVREYYGKEFRAGHCPPGLAKKKNGCMPPGQAKKWRRGAPLPRDVVFYDLPPKLVVEIGLPPAGHRYVRVANDILLIAVGTGMVLDAIEDLNRM